MRLDRWLRRRWPHLSQRPDPQARPQRPDPRRWRRGSRPRRGWRPARRCACRRCRTRRRSELRDGALEPRARLRARPGALRGRRGAGAEQAGGPGRAGRHQDHRHIDRLLGRLGRGARTAAAGAPARPRHLRRAGARQVARRRRPSSPAPSPSGARRRPTGRSSPGTPKPAEGVDRHPAGQDRASATARWSRRPIRRTRRAEPAETELRHHLPRRADRAPGWRCGRSPAAPTSCAPTCWRSATRSWAIRSTATEARRRCRAS